MTEEEKSILAEMRRYDAVTETGYLAAIEAAQGFMLRPQHSKWFRIAENFKTLRAQNRVELENRLRDLKQQGI